MLLLLLSLISSISKKSGEVVLTVEGGVSFVIDGSEADTVDLGLKIGAFAAACFCFTKAFFSRFFSYYFIRASSVNRQNSFSSAKVPSSQSKTLSYLCTVINNVFSRLYSC